MDIERKMVGGLLGLAVGLISSVAYTANIYTRENAENKANPVRSLDLKSNPNASIEDFLYPHKNEYLLADSLPFVALTLGVLAGPYRKSSS